MSLGEGAHLYLGKGPTHRLASHATLGELLRARAHLDRCALVAYESGEFRARWTYRQLGDELARVAGVLQTVHGIGHGDRVVVVSRNCAQAFLAYLALLSFGAVAVPIGNNESADTAAFIIAQTEPKLALLGPGVSPHLQSQPCPVVDLESLVRESGTAEPLRSTATLAPDDLAVILFTSGTTSSPKGVCLSHYNLLCNAEGLRRAHALGPSSVSLCVLPLYHTNAYSFSMIATLYAGAVIVLCDEFPGPALWDIIRRERVNIVSAVPSILRALSLRERQAELPEMRYFISAAAPLGKDLAHLFEARSRIPIHQGYGLSEATNFSATTPASIAPALRRRLIDDWTVPSIGPALFGNEIRIGRAGGGAAGPGEEGEILVRGHNVMQGYWRAPEATHEAFRDGWLHTGDQGSFEEIDGKRYFFVRGRLKEIIIRHGENISPLAVERELVALASVGDFAACGFANEAAGEEVGLFVSVEPTAELQARVGEIVARCPAKYRPAVVMLGAEPIPATATGKRKRALLAARFMEFRSLNEVGGAKIVRFGNDAAVRDSGKQP